MEEKRFERAVSEMSFKEASVELEQIVRALEAGDLELEDALAYYARGVELLKSLRERLSEAEQKVQVLLDDTTGKTEFDSTSAPATSYINE